MCQEFALSIEWKNNVSDTALTIWLVVYPSKLQVAVSTLQTFTGKGQNHFLTQKEIEEIKKKVYERGKILA